MPMHPGTDEHKHRFCREFIATHDPFKPSEIRWPEIGDEGRARLAALPVWDEAVSTEQETALKVQSLANVEPDPILREAIGLQGYEEARHSQMLDLMTRHYGIAVDKRPDPLPPSNPEWAFMRVSYGEQFDSFFAFGLFALARDSGFFPPGLVAVFDPIMQEEARHILFFSNWVAYRRVRSAPLERGLLRFRCGLAISLQVLSRIRTALDVGGQASQDNFAMKSHQSFDTDVTPRSFLETCLRENEKRLAPYDPRLLRPTLVPKLARLALRFLPAGQPTSGAQP
jgi:hypothetical protein